MGIYADLAGLRPMMPFSALARLIGPDYLPSGSGMITVGGRFTARIDVDGMIGKISISDRFPSTITFDGLHSGMGLDDLVASDYAFAPASPRQVPPSITIYTAKAEQDNEIHAWVGRDGKVTNFDILRPGRSYPKGGLFDNTMVPVSPCSYLDANEMLSDWAASFSPWNGAQAAFLAYAKWLQGDATPDDWHQAAANWNWENGIEPLLWMVRQPDCDKATALSIFYRSEPCTYFQYKGDARGIPAQARDAFDLASEIRRRFLDGCYTRASLAFDAADSFADQASYDMTVADDDLARDIPLPMRVPLAGRELVVDEELFDPQGLPVHLSHLYDVARTSRLVPPPASDDEAASLSGWGQTTRSAR